MDEDSAEPGQQLACYESYVDTMIALHSIDLSGFDLTHVARPEGVGLAAELAWWHSYYQWASAMTPVPGEAGLSSTRPEPKMPVVWCVIVEPCLGTRKRFFFACSTPFWIASGTSLALP